MVRLDWSTPVRASGELRGTGTRTHVSFSFVVVKVTRMRVCDICGNEQGVCRYRITKLEGSSQRTGTVDLCSDHSSVVESAIGAAPMSRRGRKPARPVVSLDEIAAVKKTPARKKAPAKKAGAVRKRA